MHTNLMISLNLDETLKIISDQAFESLDTDGSGELETSELKVVMDKVAINLGIPPPTMEDLEAIIVTLDDDYDGVINKSEFLGLIKLVL